MSVLGKLLYTHISGQAAYSTYLPGGMAPEVQAQQSVAPHATYQGLDRAREKLLDGSISISTERIEISITAATRAASASSAAWVAARIKAISPRSVIDGVTIHSLTIEDQQDVMEVYGDAGTAPARVTVIEVTGTYEET